MLLQNDLIRLRAMEPEDCEVMYRWENDTTLWHLGDTTRPFSRAAVADFISQASQDIYTARQVRFIIETLDTTTLIGTAIGCVDLFAFDPLNHRAGVGILIYEPHHRRRGYASIALQLAAIYAFQRLDLRQLWADIPVSNTASLRLFEQTKFTGDAIRRQWVQTPDGAYEDARFVQLFRSDK